MVDGGWWLVDGGWWLVDGESVSSSQNALVRLTLFTIHHSPFTIHLYSPFTIHLLHFFAIVSTRKGLISRTRRRTAGIDICHQIDFHVATIAVGCLFDLMYGDI